MATITPSGMGLARIIVLALRQVLTVTRFVVLYIFFKTLRIFCRRFYIKTGLNGATCQMQQTG